MLKEIKFDEFVLVREIILRAAQPSFYDLVKRVMDLVISLHILFLLSPLWILVALLVKLTSKGPVIYSSIVVGKEGVEFTYYKFRTMHHNCDNDEHKKFICRYVKSNLNSELAIGKYVNDTRITPFGKILRKSSLDEIPQLINVIKGEMSLIGPRPPVLYEYQLYNDWHRLRLKVLPGLTGLNQIEARSNAKFDEMVRRDLLYILNRSFRLDLCILLKTVLVVLIGRGAY